MDAILQNDPIFGFIVGMMFGFGLFALISLATLWTPKNKRRK